MINLVTDRDIKNASRNWICWKDVYEHQGALCENPLFEEDRFCGFLREYSVGRTIREGQRDAFRRRLLSGNLLKEIVDSALALDEKERELREEFGTLRAKQPNKEGTKSSLRSVLSKVASFVMPNAFIAWDRHARAGLTRELRTQNRKHKIDSYESYLSGIDLLLRGDLGAEIRNVCQGRYPTTLAAEDERFHRRVLDTYLMRIGGRSPTSGEAK